MEEFEAFCAIQIGDPQSQDLRVNIVLHIYYCFK